MYATILRAKLRSAFRDLNEGRHDRVVSAFARDAEHVFFGAHALGGRRSTPASIRAWYERLARVFPDLHFDVRSIGVTGWPWDSVATVEWTDHFALGEERASNQGVHVMRFRWGRVVSLHVHCDTQKLSAVLARKAEFGLAEAAAAPIEA